MWDEGGREGDLLSPPRDRIRLAKSWGLLEVGDG